MRQYDSHWPFSVVNLCFCFSGHIQMICLWFCILGILVFQLKRRPPDYVPKKLKKQVDIKLLKGKERIDRSGYGSSLPPEKLPYLVELSPGKNYVIRILFVFGMIDFQNYSWQFLRVPVWRICLLRRNACHRAWDCGRVVWRAGCKRPQSDNYLIQTTKPYYCWRSTGLDEVQCGQATVLPGGHCLIQCAHVLLGSIFSA